MEWALRDYGTAKWEGGDANCDHKEAKEKSRYDYSLSSSPIQNGERTDTDAPHWKDICPTCGAKKVDKQLGIEKTFQEYINRLCDIFDEVKRVLKKTGTCWVNLGDTYFGGCGGPQSWEREDRNIEWHEQSLKNPQRDDDFDYPKKSLMMIPARFAIDMISRGWILRNEIIWKKPSCMPASIKDRMTVDFEKIFFFVKNRKYFFEQQFEPISEAYEERVKYAYPGNKMGADRIMMGQPERVKEVNPLGRNKRAVWEINTQPFGSCFCENCGYFGKPVLLEGKENGFFNSNGEEEPDKRICPNCRKELNTSHFAVFPEELVESCIKPGCPRFVCKKCGKIREKIYEIKGLPRNRDKDADMLPNNKEKEGESDISGSKLRTWREENPPQFMGLSDCGCNAGFTSGVVLDPFIGSGTSMLVAEKLGMNSIGIEINPVYVEMIKGRMKPYLNQMRLDGSKSTLEVVKEKEG